MKKEKRILVLGDSVFSGYGNCFNNALDIYCKENKFLQEICIHNYSAIGMTSADAYLHFRTATKNYQYDSVIIYLGNCDVCGYGYLKPSVKIMPRVKNALRKNKKYRKRNPLAVRNKPFEYKDYNLPQNQLQNCVSITDFQSNLTAIIHHAEINKVKVLLINPVSKTDFAPANNIGNFSYYKLINIANKHSYKGGGNSDALISAIKLHEADRLSEAEIAYKKIIHEQNGSEITGIANNNLACLFVNLGDFNSAFSILEKQSNSENSIKNILLFNFAIVLYLTDRVEEANKMFAAIRDNDLGSYRITKRYREVIGKFKKKQTNNILILDVDEILSNSDLLDYCHPNIKGHKKLAQEIKDALAALLELKEGEYKPSIFCFPTNPDKFVSNKNFLDHFGLVAKTNNEFVDKIIATSECCSYKSIIKNEFELNNDSRSRNYEIILQHPLFGSRPFLKLFPPILPVDQGQFPEYYFLRHMLPIYKAYDNYEEIKTLHNGISELMPKYEKIKTWLNILMPYGALDFDEDKIAELVFHNHEDIAKRALELLENNISNEPLVFNKYRTITYWYFRESLIFGSPSHYSMFFDRVSLLNIINTCLFMNYYLEDEFMVKKKFNDILDIVDKLIKTHKKNLLPYADKIYLITKNDYLNYCSDLSEIKKLIP